MANEISVVVSSASQTGVYGLIVRQSDRTTAYDVTANDGSYVAYDRTASAQKITFSGAIAVGASIVRLFADLPSGLDSGREHDVDIYDASDELIDTFQFRPQYGLSTEVTIADDGITAAKISADAVTEIAAGVASDIMNDGDGTAVLQAIADQISADWVAGDASPLAIIAALKADPEWSTLVANVAATLEDTETTLPQTLSTTNAKIDDLPQDNLEALLGQATGAYQEPGSVGAVLHDILPTIGTPAGASIAADIAGVGASATVDAEEVTDKRTWRITEIGTGYSAPQVVRVNDGFAGTLQFDMAKTSVGVLTGTPTVAISGAASVTATNVRLRARDQKAVLFDVPALSTEGEYTVRVTASTVDSQTIPVEGALVVK